MRSAFDRGGEVRREENEMDGRKNREEKRSAVADGCS